MFPERQLVLYDFIYVEVNTGKFKNNYFGVHYKGIWLYNEKQGNDHKKQGGSFLKEEQRVWEDTLRTSRALAVSYFGTKWYYL